jgi:hypothetical protein
MMQEVLRTLPTMADLIGGHMADLFAGVRSVADWAKRLKPSVLAEARSAYDAYRKGDTEPMKDFLRRCLRLWPVLEDHCPSPRGHPRACEFPTVPVPASAAAPRLRWSRRDHSLGRRSDASGNGTFSDWSGGLIVGMANAFDQVVFPVE